MNNLYWFAALVLVIIMARAAAWLWTREETARIRDPKRMPPRSEVHAVFREVGYRCEWRSIFGRCSATSNLCGDHWIPWSKGGASTSKNMVCLCARHNGSGFKGAKVPYVRQTDRLFRARQTYMREPVRPGEIYYGVSRKSSI